MKGVILEIAPEAQIIDISHAVQPFDILDGALTISQAYSYFPSGTVHMVIVDPGVGTARRPVIMTGDRHLFVAPDNGVLSLIYDREERHFGSPRHRRALFSAAAQQHLPRARYLLAGRGLSRQGSRTRVASAKRSPTTSALARRVPSRWTSGPYEEWC